MFPFEYWAATKPSSRASVQAQAFSSQELNQKGTMAWMWSQLLCVTVQVALWTSIVQTHHHHLSLLLHHLIKLLPRCYTFKSVMASQISSTMNSPCYIPLSRWLFFVNVSQDELYVHCVGLNSSGSRCLKILTLNSCHHLTMVPTTLLKLVLLLSWLMRYCTCILII